MLTSYTPRWARCMRSPAVVTLTLLLTVGAIVGCVLVLTLTDAEVPTSVDKCCGSIDGWSQLYCTSCSTKGGCNYQSSVCDAHLDWTQCCAKEVCKTVPQGAVFSVCNTHIDGGNWFQGFSADLTTTNLLHWPLFGMLLSLASMGAIMLIVRVGCVHSVQHDSAMGAQQQQQQLAYYAAPPHAFGAQQPVFGQQPYQTMGNTV